ncbi:MAG: hypothetical protein EBR82_67055 [Caulobacteraceae bacterium]|nr:hypothetical protein [Caulobacteraceae bacterium]
MGQYRAVIYLALDQSSNITGYSVWQDSELIEYGKIKFEGEFIQRVVELNFWMIDKIKEAEQEGQDIQVVIEEIQEQSNMQTYKKLAMLQGVLLAELYKRKIGVHLVYAASWKSSCGIKGRSRIEQKNSAQQHVREKYGYEVTQDEADAICLGEHISSKIQNWGRH